MSAWIPSDDQLDALARGLPPLAPVAARAEQTRTTLLASAATAKQQSRRSGTTIAVAIAIPLAAAAAIALWIGTRTATAPKDIVVAHGTAKYEFASEWPDRLVRLDDGAIDVELQPLDADERFRVRLPDGELESRDARFALEVRKEHVSSIVVSRGRVELRITGSSPVFLSAGQAWTPPITAQRDVIVPQRDVAQPRDVVVPQHDATPPRDVIVPHRDATPRRDVIVPQPDSNVARRVDPKPDPRPVPAPNRQTAPAKPTNVPTVEPQTPKDVPPTVPPTTPQVPPPSPGEAEFRAGMIALRNGDAGAAAASFATACSTAQAALAEDACFWVGAAARRANQTATARDALGRFLQRFPSSSRAGEAAALLGWILFEAGDLDGAERRFKQAANDRVPKVRESANRGLAAVEKKRAK